MTLPSLPLCQKCAAGTLLPLSDYGRDGAPIKYKAWAQIYATAVELNSRVQNHGPP